MAAWALWGAGAPAQDLAALARLDPTGSAVMADGEELALTLVLSQPVPWRLRTHDAPPRLVVELREVDWRGAAFPPAGASSIDLGHVDGWSRLTVTLAAPMAVASAGMRVDEATGAARLDVALAPTDAASFAAAATPEGPPPPDPAPPDDRFVVAIDPGHGGVDPGAEREGLREAHLMLALGVELAEALRRQGVDTVLTRDVDDFVSLPARVSIARAGGADVLVSLHADALAEDEARGASVYTLSAEAVDEASARVVARHGRDDLIGGLDLLAQDDAVATALLDLARAATQPRSERLAAALVDGLGGAGAALNGRPLREAPLAVLDAADFPSALVEVGFLSDGGDRARLSTPEGRALVVAGLVAGLLAWRAAEGP